MVHVKRTKRTCVRHFFRELGLDGWSALWFKLSIKSSMERVFFVDDEEWSTLVIEGDGVKLDARDVRSKRWKKNRSTKAKKSRGRCYLALLSSNFLSLWTKPRAIDSIHSNSVDFFFPKNERRKIFVDDRDGDWMNAPVRRSNQVESNSNCGFDEKVIFDWAPSVRDVFHSTNLSHRHVEHVHWHCADPREVHLINERTISTMIRSGRLSYSHLPRSSIVQTIWLSNIEYNWFKAK